MRKNAVHQTVEMRTDMLGPKGSHNNNFEKGGIAANHRRAKRKETVPLLHLIDRLGAFNCCVTCCSSSSQKAPAHHIY